MDNNEPRNQRRSRKPRQGKRAGAAKRVRQYVIPLPETEAVLALSSGALAAPLPPLISSAPGRVQCWEGRVPARVAESLAAGAGFGGLLFLKVADDRATVITEGLTTSIALPLAVARISSAVAASPEYLELLLARLADFPDVVLDALPLEVDAGVIDYGNWDTDLFEQAADNDRAVDAGHADRPGADRGVPVGAGHADGGVDEGVAVEAVHDDGPPADKVGGAVAGLLAALLADPSSSEGDVQHAWRAVSSADQTTDTATALILRVGCALSPTPPDAAARVFCDELVKRLAHMGTKTGIEPGSLAAEVVEAAKQSVPDSSELDHFRTAAEMMMLPQSAPNRDLLQDGGSIILRGALAFLRTPSVERLEALVAKGGRLGSRVGAFALTLAGYYEGTTAMARRFKAGTAGTLLALGEVIESMAHALPIRADDRREMDSGGRLIWVPVLHERVIGRRLWSLPPALEVVALTVESCGWTPLMPETNGLRFAVAEPGYEQPITAQITSEVPFEPQSPLVALSVTFPVGRRKGSVPAEALLAAATAHGLFVQSRASGASVDGNLTVYLLDSPATREAVVSASSRLAAAAKALREAATSSSRGRTRTETEAAPTGK
jgi:hypothetical protein